MLGMSRRDSLSFGSGTPGQWRGRGLRRAGRVWMVALQCKKDADGSDHGLDGPSSPGGGGGFPPGVLGAVGRHGARRWDFFVSSRVAVRRGVPELGSIVGCVARVWVRKIDENVSSIAVVRCKSEMMPEAGLLVAVKMNWMDKSPLGVVVRMSDQRGRRAGQVQVQVQAEYCSGGRAERERQGNQTAGSSGVVWPGVAWKDREHVSKGARGRGAGTWGSQC